MTRRILLLLGALNLASCPASADTLGALRTIETNAAAEHASTVCIFGQYASTECTAALEKLNEQELNSILAEALKAAHSHLNAPPLEPRQRYLATLVAVDTILNAGWEALYAAALNAATNALSSDLRQATLTATLSMADSSEWGKARAYIKQGLRGLVLSSLTRKAFIDADEVVVDPIFAAAAARTWRHLLEGAKQDKNAEELGRITFAEAQKIALMTIIKNMPQMWQLTYNGIADNLATGTTTFQCLMARWPLNGSNNTYFAPYAQLLKEAKAG